jgi:hypothetical protein
MLFFHATGGRLGNQLFSTALIERRRKPGELIITTQMAESRAFLGRLHRYFDFSNPLVVNFADHVVSRFIVWPLIRARVISSLVEDERGVRETRGILPVTYFRGFFQAPRYMMPTPITRKWIRREFLAAASAQVSRAYGRTALFVHIRRGDYARHRVHENRSVVLPMNYYRKALRLLEREVKDPHFFLLSDDPDWCESQFADLPHRTVSRGSSFEDLALMSLCAGGIASNSSFSWWGGLLCARTAPLIAPRYWLGWTRRCWLPPGIEESDFRFIDVPEGDQGERE